MDFEMNVGHGIIRSYRRLGYRAWYALAEFIDNTTQNYAEHKDVLATAGDCPPLEINIDYDKEHLRISDNAMGMNFEELERALKIGVPPPNTTGRSEYGLGLKTAASWFGDLWTITTKRFGETTEYEVEVDIDKVAKGNLTLPTKIRENRDPKLHHTIVDIRRLHHKYHHQTKKRIEMYIRSMYRIDLRNADLWITFNGKQPLTAESPATFLKDSQGAEWKRSFSTEIGGKKVSGWLGILNPGERRSAGIAIIRRGRAIKGQPDAWRPFGIFGIERNDLINQRLVGEINLDSFTVSHTKDEILWEDEDENDLEKYLTEEFKEYIAVARKPRKDLGDTPVNGPTPAEEKVGLSELRQTMESPDFADLIELQEVPSDEVVKQATAPLIEVAEREEPAQVIRIGQGDRQITCKIHLNDEASPNDPYFAASYAVAQEVLVSINRKHPHYLRIRGGAIGAMAYYMDCVYDALAEYKALRANTVKHDTIKVLKDGFLRHEIALDATDPEPPPDSE